MELVTNQNLADAAIASSRADDAEGSYMYMLTLGDQVTCSANCVLTIMMKQELDDVHLSAAGDYLSPAVHQKDSFRCLK